MPREPWTPKELRLLAKLESPRDVQAFLDGIAYSSDELYRCPRRVLRDRRAHCFDGAMFAAAALRRLGYEPLLVGLRAVRDDDHIIAVFRERGALGAVAKSNFVGLRYREPIHRSVRELVLTYFDGYYNLDGERTLRSYSGLLDLRSFDQLPWRTEDGPMEVIADRLDALRHFPIVTPAMAAGLGRVDERTYRAHMLGVNEAGLYRPGGAKG